VLDLLPVGQAKCHGADSVRALEIGATVSDVDGAGPKFMLRDCWACSQRRWPLLLRALAISQDDGPPTTYDRPPTAEQGRRTTDHGSWTMDRVAREKRQLPQFWHRGSNAREGPSENRRRLRRYPRRGAPPEKRQGWRFSERGARFSGEAPKVDASSGEERLLLGGSRGESPAGKSGRKGEAPNEGWPGRHDVRPRPSATLQRLDLRAQGIPSEAGRMTGWLGTGASIDPGGARARIGARIAARVRARIGARARARAEALEEALSGAGGRGAPQAQEGIADEGRDGR
jgi:hypothetical protein